MGELLQPLSGSNIGPILPETDIEIDIDSPWPVESIGLIFATYCRTNKNNITVQINGREHKLAAASLADNEWVNTRAG
jgi:hypothetical protein